MYTILLLLFCIAFIIVASTRYKLHPFLALLSASLIFGIFSGLPLDRLIKTINDGFGGTIGGIGIIIIAGLIIGTFLEKSGGAYTLANLVLKIIGPKRVHMAMGFIGYFVSIPVFADSGFIIVSPLNRALTKRAKLSLAGTAVALSLGLMASHTMVPPTPGPIAAAGILGADLGQVILFGLMTSIPALLVCVLFAKKIGSKIFIDPAPKLTEEQIDTQLESAPSVFKSFIPIVVPIILIVLRSFAEYPTMPFGDGTFRYAIGFVGNPVVALLIGMVLSFTLPKKLDKEMLGTSGWIGEALTSAAIIILITGAGGAFGKVLQTSDIGSLLEQNVSSGNLGIWLPFLIAAGIKTAQGSSTVAIITTASIIAPLMPAMGFDTGTSKALAVIAIGAGASLVSHANDSFFWVVAQLSDMKVNQGYRTHSLGTAILGLSAMIILTIISLII
ncbi:MAG: SLC13 family permease [Flavobacteriaceae bacterium]